MHGAVAGTETVAGAVGYGLVDEYLGSFDRCLQIVLPGDVGGYGRTEGVACAVNVAGVDAALGEAAGVVGAAVVEDVDEVVSVGYGLDDHRAAGFGYLPDEPVHVVEGDVLTG